MLLPIQVTLRDVGPSPSLRDYALSRAKKLDTFYERITSCRVMIEAPHRHHQHGKRYHVRIDLTVPGGELVVGRTSPENVTHEDPYACIDDAFDDAQRLVQDWSRKRNDVTEPAPERSRYGKVVRLFLDEGYGFLENDEGDHVYFHRNSVSHEAFSRLHVGTEVRFGEEFGEKGPQATFVEIVRH